MHIKTNKYNSYKVLSIITKLFRIIILLYFLLLINVRDFKIDKKSLKKIKIGVIGEHYIQNIGNNLLKYALFNKLKELGFDPQIIGYQFLAKIFQN
jgi:hypothetical protein